MAKVVVKTSGGVGFLGLLAIVFIVLKLLGKITWSWWWVLCPLWGPVALAAGIVVVIAVIALIVFLICCAKG